jgi:hypothetical protein
VKNIPSTKVELSHNKIDRMNGLDDLARILFPAMRPHQEIFLAIFVELKYAPGEFLPSLLPLCDKYGFTPRRLETVRSKMRRMGLIDHVCRFNGSYGYREGWVFSRHFPNSLVKLAKSVEDFKQNKGENQEMKDKDVFRYL